jgi:hypothetical protein
MKPPPLKGGLAVFGITPAAGGKTNYNNKNSKLRCVMIAGPEMTSAVIFRLEPNDRTLANGSWAEKVFFDAIRTGEGWVTSINVDTRCLDWYHENVSQKNPRGYSIRLFIIRTDGHMPPKENIVKLGQYICQNINAAPANNTTTTIQEENFFGSLVGQFGLTSLATMPPCGC